jgi:hypothetical protein
LPFGRGNPAERYTGGTIHMGFANMAADLIKAVIILIVGGMVIGAILAVPH